MDKWVSLLVRAKFLVSDLYVSQILTRNEPMEWCSIKKLMPASFDAVWR